MDDNGNTKDDVKVPAIEDTDKLLKKDDDRKVVLKDDNKECSESEQFNLISNSNYCRRRRSHGNG